MLPLRPVAGLDGFREEPQQQRVDRVSVASWRVWPWLWTPVTSGIHAITQPSWPGSWTIVRSSDSLITTNGTPTVAAVWRMSGYAHIRWQPPQRASSRTSK